MIKFSLRVLAPTVLALSVASLATAGPLSTLYGTDGDRGTGFIMSGNSFTTFGLVGDEYALGVGSTVRTLGNGNQGDGGGSIPGSEYSLAGVPTGTSYSYPVPSAFFYDG